MAFVLTPRFAPAYTTTQCSPFSCVPVRPSYRRVSRPAFPSFVPFLSQVDDLLSELDREARREAHRQRQQRKRAFRAHFNVHENKEGYQVDGEIAGFEQENVEIEVTDDHTLRVAGNTEKRVERHTQPETTPAPAAQATEAQTTETETQDEAMEGITLNEPELETAASGAATPTHSDTESHKSYQATVEDDFEDLGAETSSTLSAGPDAEAEPHEPKGKEKVVEEPTIETTVQQQPQPEAPAQQQQEPEPEPRFRGSFERTFRFPERIDAANVRASLKNGLLSITVPKAKAPEVRKVLIL